MKSISNYDNIKNMNNVSSRAEENLQRYKSITKDISELSKSDNLVTVYEDLVRKFDQLEEENYFKENVTQKFIMENKMENMKTILKEEDIENLEGPKTIIYYSNYNQAIDTYNKVVRGDNNV